MAERSGYDGVLNNAADGKPMAGLEVTVKTAANTDATIYTTKLGGTLKSNPITTDSTGLIQFWVEPGYYELEVHDTDVPARISDRRIPFNAVAGDVGGIDFDQLEIPIGSIVSGDLKLRTHVVTGPVLTGTADHVIASQASVEPGIYYATGFVELTIDDYNGAGDLRFTNTGGTAAIYQTQLDSNSSNIVSAVIVVTATTTINLKGTYSAGFGSKGALTLFGVGS